MKQTKTKDSDFFSGSKEHIWVCWGSYLNLFLIRGIKQRLFYCRDCTKYTCKTTDGSMHNLLYTSVGFIVQTTDSDMIPTRGWGGGGGEVVWCGAGDFWQ